MDHAPSPIIARTKPENSQNNRHQGAVGQRESNPTLNCGYDDPCHWRPQARHNQAPLSYSLPWTIESLSGVNLRYLFRVTHSLGDDLTKRRRSSLTVAP